MNTDTPKFRRTAQRCQQKMTTLLQDCLYQQTKSQSDMCDVTLVIGGVEMKAHWCVLAVCPYFESVYKSDMKEKLAGKITLGFGDPTAIRAAIRFLYTGTVEITDKNIREIFQASDFFQIEQLKELCSEFLLRVSITVKNCVGLCILGNLYNLESVYTRALKFMNGHLAEVLEEDEALTLTTDFVVDMITNETLRYVSVEQSFGFLVKWVEYDLLQREEHFCDLFSHLNLSRVTNTCLTSKIERHSFVKNCVKCQTHLTDHKEKLKTGQICQETEEKVVVLVLGGESRGTVYITHSVYAYIITENRWVQLPPLPRVEAKPHVASDGKQAVYVIDTGFGRLVRINRYEKLIIYKYVPGSKEWLVLNVEIPTNFSMQDVEEISCVGGKVFVMLRAKSNHSDSGWNCHICELNEIDLKLEEKCLFFTQCNYSQYKCCTGMDRYICVCFTERSVLYNPGQDLAKFVYYDSDEDILFNSSEVSYFPQDVMYAKENEIVLALPGSTDARSFNLDSRKWRNQCTEFALPLPTEETKKRDYCYCYHERQFYMFGGINAISRPHVNPLIKFNVDTQLYSMEINATSKHPVNSVIKFNIDTQQCDSMENLPEPMMNSACCVMTLPTDLLRCHLDCPHCEILRSNHPTKPHQQSFTSSYDEDGYDEDGYDDGFDGNGNDYGCYDSDYDHWS